MPDHDVDLFIIGGGSGGVRAARIAAGYGARVMVAEEYRVGGTCVIRGCVPKKLLVYAARFADEFEDAAGYRLDACRSRHVRLENADRQQGSGDRPARGGLHDHAGARQGHARQGPRGARGRPYGAPGSQAAQSCAPGISCSPPAARPIPAPTSPGLEHVISSNEAFHLDELPQRILIQGGGYIAVEFAGIFNGLGSQVTLVYRGENILRGFDDDVREHLRSEMERRGIKIITRQTVAGRSRRSSTGFCVELSDRRSFMVDRVMFATGRRPNVSGLGLEAAGVRLAQNGGIAVDAFSQTSVPSIHAVGDVTNRVNLTPVAIREGHAFADTVFGGKPHSGRPCRRADGGVLRA